MAERSPQVNGGAAGKPQTARGWLRVSGGVLKGAGRDMFTDRIIEWAGAVAFFGVLSLFPLLLAGASLAAHFVDPQLAVEYGDRVFSKILPGSAELVEDAILEAFEASGRAGVFSFIALLWFGTQVFNTLTIALNIAYDAEEADSFLKRSLLQLVMAVTLGTLFLVALAANVVLDHLWRELDVLPDPGLVIGALKSIVPLVLLFLAFVLCYRFVPRGPKSWRAAMVGAGSATLLFRAARPLFMAYVEEIGEYPSIYGSLAVVIVLLVWAWITSIVVLFGGEVASHFQMLALEGKGDEEVKQKHQARSGARPRRSPGGASARAAGEVS